MLRKGANVPKYFTASNRLYESSYDIEQRDQDSDDVEKHGRNKGAEKYILLYPKTSLRHRLRVNYDKFIDFMERLLKIDPKERMSTRQALQHPCSESNPPTFGVLFLVYHGNNLVPCPEYAI